jgi:hypothetical protein
MGVGQGGRWHYGVGGGDGNVRVVYSTTSRSGGPEWYGRRLLVYGKRRSVQPVSDGEGFVVLRQ